MKRKGFLSAGIGILSFCMMCVFTPTSNISAAGGETWIDHAAASYAAGDGSQQNPYQISTAEELALLAKQANDEYEYGGRLTLNKFYQLTSDIDLSAYPWVPIGESGWNTSKEGMFKGYFDGNHKKIEGLKINNSNSDCYVGLFSTVVGRPEHLQPIIQNLTIQNANVEITTNIGKFDSHYTGILAGSIVTEANDKSVAFVENVHVSGSIRVNNVSFTGGIAGFSQFVTFKDSTSDVQIDNTYGYEATGGLIGKAEASGAINCESNGSIIGNYSVGGLVGLTSLDTKIEKCISRTAVKGLDWNIGGFVGYANSGENGNPGTEITNSAAYGDVTSMVTGWEPKVGGFAGTNDGTIKLSYAANKVTGSHPTIQPGGFLGHGGIGTVEDSSFDAIKNPNLPEMGEAGTGTNQIKKEKDLEVLTNICNNVYGSHAYSSEWTIDQNPTAVQEGSKSHHCTRCDSKSDVMAIPKLIVNKVEAKAASCTEKGNIEYWYSKDDDKYFSDENATTEITQADTIIEMIPHTDEYVNAVDADCTKEGNIEYWYCTVCKKYFSDAALTNEITKQDTIIAKTTHKTSKTEAAPSDCTKEGNIEYWHCSVCNKYFSDAALTNEITRKDTIIAKTAHNTSKTEAMSADCTKEGNIEYWHCSVCDKYFSDKALTKEITRKDTIIAKTAHNTSKTEAVSADCTKEGNIEYWHCSVCDKYFSDKALTKEITKQDTIIAKEAHKPAKVEAKAATCTKEGNIEYWHCSVCDKYFNDAALTKEITKKETVISKLPHTAKHVDAVAATCTSEGNIEHWYCSVCNKYFSDTALTKEITKENTVVKAAHNAKKVEALDATCISEGNIAYWYCSVCDKYFSDAALKKEITKEDTKIDIIAHNAKKVKALAPTCSSKGNLEYWFCAVCDKYFSDATLTKEITKEETMIDMIPHTAEKIEALEPSEESDGNIAYWYCSVCDKYFSNPELTNEIQKSDIIVKAKGNQIEKENQDETSNTDKEVKTNTPDTGDHTSTSIWALMLTIDLGLMYLLYKLKNSFREN